MADVGIRATLDGFSEAVAGLDRIKKSVQSISDAQTTSLQASLKYADAWTRQHQAMTNTSDDIQKIINRYDPLGGKLQRLQQDFADLDKAIVAGATRGTSDVLLDKTMKSINEEINKTKEAMNQATPVVNEFGAAIAGLALRYVAPLAIGYELLNLWRETTAVAREVELQNIRLNTVLQSTGMVAGFTGVQLDKMANAMQETFAIDSEKVKQAMTVLLTFTNIQGEMFTKTLKLGADYSRLYGGDMASAVRMFGRAFEDPERGVTMLRRANIILDEEQIKLIKNLANTGDQLGAMVTMLDIVQGKMNDMAETVGKSGVVAVERFKNAWSDMMKEISKTTEDPSGVEGFWTSTLKVATSTIKFLTDQRKTYREAEMRGMMEAYRADATAMDTATGEYKFDLETRLHAWGEYNKYRKALGIQTLREQTVEEGTIEEGKNKKFDGNMKKYWKDWGDLQVKQINDRKALGLATAQDEARLMRFLSAQEGLNETERLNFLAKEHAALKEGQKLTEGRITGEGQLLAIQTKGQLAAIESQLKLGRLTQEEADRQKAIVELENNYRMQLDTEAQLRLILTPEARQTLEYKREQLAAEFQIRAAALGQTEQLTTQNKWLKENKLVNDLVIEGAKERQKEEDKQVSQAVAYDAAVKDTLDKEAFRLSLVGQTKDQQEILTALNKLELDYKRAIVGLGPDLLASVTANYEVDRVSIARAIKMNQTAADEVTEFWKQAARNMQDAMSNLFFDVMQGKLSDLAGSVKQTIDRMVANFLAAKASMALFGKDFVREPGVAPIGGWVGQGLGVLGNWWSGLGGAPGFSLADLSSAGGGSGVSAAAAAGSYFATGGSFTVGGSGGTDSQPVGFRATPGEKVTVETPEQQRRGGRPAINFNGPLITVYANDVQSFNKSRGQIGAEMYVLANNFARRFT